MFGDALEAIVARLTDELAAEPASLCQKDEGPGGWHAAFREHGHARLQTMLGGEPARVCLREAVVMHEI